MTTYTSIEELIAAVLGGETVTMNGYEFRPFGESYEVNGGMVVLYGEPARYQCYNVTYSDGFVRYSGPDDQGFVPQEGLVITRHSSPQVDDDGNEWVDEWEEADVTGVSSFLLDTGFYGQVMFEVMTLEELWARCIEVHEPVVVDETVEVDLLYSTKLGDGCTVLWAMTPEGGNRTCCVVNDAWMTDGVWKNIFFVYGCYHAASRMLTDYIGQSFAVANGNPIGYTQPSCFKRAKRVDSLCTLDTYSEEEWEATAAEGNGNPYVTYAAMHIGNTTRAYAPCF